MTVLSSVADMRVGTTSVLAAYRGDVPVWERPWTPLDLEPALRPGFNQATGEVDVNAAWTTALTRPTVLADDDVRAQVQ